jgi:hypothetical protein
VEMVKEKSTKGPPQAHDSRGENSQQAPASLTIRLPPLAKNVTAPKGTKRKKAASVSDSSQNKRAKTKAATLDNKTLGAGQ